MAWLQRDCRRRKSYRPARYASIFRFAPGDSGACRLAGPISRPERTAADYARDLEKAILAEGPETVAAFIAEPVKGAGGVLVPAGPIIFARFASSRPL